ncbi:MAG: hypothetical protein JW867_05500 [Candidatus Omnitrophica bacterium]|nr:hypothetical protein [Candidatus Omnitrophota bacterium]
MLIKLKKAQATAEYAILFALVVAAVMGVQNYVKRSLQARIYDAANDFIDATGGTTLQWHGIQTDKVTTDQVQTKEFIEDYDNPEEPFSYDTKSSSDYRSVTIE